MLDPAADMSDPNAKSDQGVSASKATPTCAYPGCTSHSVPLSSFCGDERHTAANAIKASDGTITGLSDITGSIQSDGTGRSKRRKPRHVKTSLRQALHHGELRADQALTPGHAILSGTAIVYDVRTVITDMFGKFGETIRQGAAGHLLNGDVRLLANHGGLPLARTISKSLILEQDSKGVHFAAEVDVQGSPLAADVVSGVRRGNLSGCSFAFTVNDAGDSWNKAMTEREILHFASIPEISIVTFPAYPTTSVAARNKALDLKRQHYLARRELLIRRRPIVTTQEGSR